MGDDTRSRVAFDAARQAFELIDDGVVFADLDDRLLFANLAAARLAGRSSAPEPGSDAQALMDEGMAAGADIVRVTRHGADGRPTGWTAVLREPRLAHRGEGSAAGPTDTAAVLELIARTEPGATLEETATRICDIISSLPYFDGAMVLLIPPSGDLIHLSHGSVSKVPFKSGQRMPLRDLEAIIDLTIEGPWAVSTLSGEALRLFGPFTIPMRLAGVRASAYAGMLVAGKLLGVVSVVSIAKDGLQQLEAHLDTLAQLAGVAGTLLGGQASGLGRDRATREQVRDVLEHRRFHPVFQPIVRLTDGAVFAYEALTRFDDGVAPDAHFIDAAGVGLDRELEEAAARLALEAAAALPAGLPITLNFSPDVVIALAGTDLLQQSARPLIVEITEHTQIEDYGRLITTLQSLPHIPLSVDDAGAGFASLRHILELQPAFVKLDIGLVRDVHRDPARAALVAGMVHFARSTGTELIAEGVESAEETDALRDLGVAYAQGYHFAMPAPAETFGAS